ncbi:hypothetical protein P6F26_13710 [Roseibacterium sp. SDUM158017]|uniref:hypothetical protein n=1 Tax=Roseicyclus salinarum TaxID=3036773 RepID=UPI002415772C|nr:hypothetical protein [Roseibacterium sp. SDUM158017]MDG4649494.1 hypothetical protein [Roseibacterium sp. SDUM158017]
MAALRVLPADITVLAGRFGRFPAAQPLVFAHLWDVAPEIDPGHVEVIPAEGGTARLAAYFDAATIAGMQAGAGDADTLVLILPEAYEGIDPPAPGSDRMAVLGTFRGRLRRSLGSAP